jgi:hypothetical protein
MIDKIRSLITSAENAKRHAEALSTRGREMDLALVTMFGKSFSVRQFSMHFMSDIHENTDLLTHFKEIDRSGVHVYENRARGRTVHINFICGRANRWINMTKHNYRKFTGLFASPLACREEQIKALSDQSLEELEELSLGFEG